MWSIKVGIWCLLCCSCKLPISEFGSSCQIYASIWCSLRYYHTPTLGDCEMKLCPFQFLHNSSRIWFFLAFLGTYLRISLKGLLQFPLLLVLGVAGFWFKTWELVFVFFSSVCVLFLLTCASRNTAFNLISIVWSLSWSISIGLSSWKDSSLLTPINHIGDIIVWENMKN